MAQPQIKQILDFRSETCRHAFSRISGIVKVCGC